MVKIFLPVLLLVHLVILSRLTFTAWPEMLFYPYLFLNGFSFYKDFIMPYPPALPLFLSGIYSLFGVTPEVLKIPAWILILSTDILLFLILTKVLKSGFLALPFLAIYILLQSFFDGNMLWFDFATTAPLLAALFFILKWLESGKTKELFWVGFFLALAILIKQTAGIYLLGFLAVFMWIRGIRGICLPATLRVARRAGGLRGRREIPALAGGVLMVGIPLVFYLTVTGGFLHFFNWVLFYPLTEWSRFPGYVDFLVPKRYILAAALFLSPIAFILFNFKILKEKSFLLSLIFLVASLIAVYPRFSFFHLQPAVAFTVISFAVLFASLPKKLRIFHLLLIATTSFFVVKIILPLNQGEPIRFYGENDKRLAGDISVFAGTDRKIFLLGLDSSLYVFSGTLPPKNWSDNFGWYLEIPGVQEWVLEGLESGRPDKILWRVPATGLWFEPGVYQPEKIVNYLKTNYDKEKELEPGLSIWTRKD